MKLLNIFSGEPGRPGSLCEFNPPLLFRVLSFLRLIEPVSLCKIIGNHIIVQPPNSTTIGVVDVRPAAQTAEVKCQ